MFTKLNSRVLSNHVHNAVHSWRYLPLSSGWWHQDSGKIASWTVSSKAANQLKALIFSSISKKFCEWRWIWDQEENAYDLRAAEAFWWIKMIDIIGSVLWSFRQSMILVDQSSAAQRPTMRLVSLLVIIFAEIPFWFVDINSKNVRTLISNRFDLSIIAKCRKK